MLRGKIITRLIFLILCLYTLPANSQDKENYYFVFLNTNPDREEISEEKQQALQQEHLANIDRLYKARKLIAAGPLVGGGGIFILIAHSLEEAQDSLNSDPAIKAQRFKIEVFPFTVNAGKLCWLENENEYEMVNYQLVRFTPADKIAGADSLKKRLAAHEQFINRLVETGSMIIAGVFNGGQGGGMLLLKVETPEAAEKIAAGHPLIAEKTWENSLRTLWIAKESLCQ
jgi:uncharacterized protein YciI